MLSWATGAMANPAGPQVAAGAASFQTSGKTLTVTNTPGTILNWSSFSIAPGESTRFQQQSALSAVLNRVTGANPSSILGTLSSNGRVFLVNPHGIVFGQGSVINTAGFVASTLNISDADFLAGRMKFESGGNGVLRNEGTIQAGGDIFLVGPQIENAGLIKSDNGSVLLAAGQSVTITSPDAHGVQFALQAPTDRVLNLGTIEAKNAAGLFAGTLKHSGDIRVTSASVDASGRVILAAQKDAILDGNASISVDNTAGKGGAVQITGERVGLFDNATVTARGAAGGGEILVGGDYQGKNHDVRNAAMTHVAPGAMLDASATAAGDGGRVIVWADDTTRMHGSLFARGGPEGGNGGMVEASGKSFLDFAGAVDTSAPLGLAGTLLLDPSNVNITTTADAFAGGSFTSGEFSGAAGVSTITWATIESQLASNNVVITTTGSGGAGNLTVSAPRTYNSNNKLSFLAHNDLSLGAGGFISNTGAGDLLFVAGWDGISTASPVVTNGVGNMGIGWGLTANGAMTFKAGGTMALGTYNNGTDFLRSANAGITLSAGGNIELNNSCCGPGTDNLRASGVLAITSTNGHVTNGRTVHLVGDGGIAISAGTNIGNVTTGAVLGTLAATGVGGDVTLTAGTAGAGGIRLDSQAVTANDSITLTAPGRIEIANGPNITASNGSLSVTSTGADVVRTVSAGGTWSAGTDLTVNAVTGVSVAASSLIAGTGGNGRIVVASSGAAGDVGVGVARATHGGLAANQYGVDISSGRDVFISSTNSNSTTNFAALGSGGIRIDAANNVDLNTNCCGGGTDTYSATGNIDVTAVAGQIISGRQVNLSGGNVTLTAGTNVGPVTTGQTMAIAATAAGGDITITAGSGGSGAIRFDSAPITANDSITLTAPGRIDIANSLNITATNGSLSVASTGADVVRTVSAGGTWSAGTDLTVNAVTGISVAASPLIAGTGGNGKIVVASSGAAGDVGVGVVRATNAGLAPGQYAVDISSGRDVFISSTNSNSTTNFAALGSGGIRINAANGVELNTNCCGPGTDTYAAAGDFVISAGTGNISASRVVNISGDSVYFSANATINPGGAITAPNTISYSVTNSDLTIGALSAQTVILNSTNGAILDGNGGANNITATTLTATANTGISLDSNVTSFSAENSGTGAVSIREANGATITGAGTVSGAVTLTTGSGTLTNTGTLALPGGATITGGFANQGTITVGGGTADFGSGTFAMDGGSVDVAAGATLLKGGGVFSWGDGMLAGAGTYTLPGGMTLTGSGARVLNGPTLNLGLTTLPAGSLTVQGGALNFGSTATISSGAMLEVAGGSVTGALSIDVQGLLKMSGGTLTAASVGLVPGGMLSGTGTVNAPVVNGGTISVGASPGTLIINGNYSQTALGMLDIELGGTTQGINYDLLQVTGAASLNGTLNVALFGGFTGAAGNVFDVLTYGSRTGDFATVNFPAGYTMTATPNAAFYQLAINSLPAVPPVVPPSSGGGDSDVQIVLPASEVKILNDKFLAAVDAGKQPEEEEKKGAVLECK